MSQALVDQVAQAVLYEGYVLYPYRPCVKTVQRWTFGGIFPEDYSRQHPGADDWSMQCQCLVRGGAGAEVRVQGRFLQVQVRTSDHCCESWQEAVERQVDGGTVTLGAAAGWVQCKAFSFPHHRRSETMGGRRIVRERQRVSGEVELSARRLERDLFQVTARLSNRTEVGDGSLGRDEALLRAFASTHMVLTVDGGGFVSLTDPPEALRERAERCCNVGCWPVLVGEAGQTDTLLASPIILYDYPQIAPQSPGDLFDGTEIDEILTLRILTMTEAEKEQAAATDERVRKLLERTEALGREQLMKLHGVMHGPGQQPLM